MLTSLVVGDLKTPAWHEAHDDTIFTVNPPFGLKAKSPCYYFFFLIEVEWGRGNLLCPTWYAKFEIQPDLLAYVNRCELELVAIRTLLQEMTRFADITDPPPMLFRDYVVN